MAKKSKTTDAVQFRVLAPHVDQGLYDLRTEGLEVHGHRELQALCPGFTVHYVIGLFGHYVDSVLKGEHRFETGEKGDIHGFSIEFIEVPGDTPDAPPRLRLVDYPTCPECAAEREQGDGITPRVHSHTEWQHVSDEE